MLARLIRNKVYQQLQGRAEKGAPLAIKYRGLLDSSYERINTYLDDIRRYFHHFTDHSIAHSLRILDNVASIMTSKQLEALADAELYLLIASVLVHDIGMVLPESEVQQLSEDPTFLAEQEAILRRNGLPPSQDWTFGGVERLVVAEYMRRRHGKRAALALAQGIGPCQQLTGGDRHLAKFIGAICEGHQAELNSISNTDTWPTNVMIDGEHVNIQFLVICLRIGDLLDITTKRASPDLRYLSDPLVALSAAHWDQYTDVEVRGLSPGSTITIAGTSPSQEAERILREWVGWLQKESEQAVIILNASPDQYHLCLGRIDYRVRPRMNPDGTPIYKFFQFRFNLDEERVFQRLLGTRLYGRTNVVLRELVQNAVDATRVRVALECSKEPGWDTRSTQSRRHKVLEVFRQRAEQLAIRVSLEEKIDESGQPRVWLHVADAGVGMAPEVIDKFLLKVGRSRWRDDPRIVPLQIGTVGEFGIGFVSTLTISERVVVLTQSCAPDEEGLRATIFGWNGYLSTQPVRLPHPGTCISLQLTPDAVSDMSDLDGLVEFWFPFLELPIIASCRGGQSRTVTSIALRPDTAESLLFKLDGSESVACIGSVHANAAQGRPLSQDGITIPDVPPPTEVTAEHRLLQKRGIRIDLRGEDRVQLDLSRNLVEGGAEEMWRKLVPKIWNSIARNCLDHPLAQETYAEYLQAEFESSLGHTAFALGPMGAVSRQDISASTLQDQVQFADSAQPHLGRLAASDSHHTLLLPKPPSALRIGVLYRGIDIPGLKRFVLAHHKDYSTEEHLADGLLGNRTYWAQRGREGLEGQLSWPSLATLNKYLAVLFPEFTYLSQSDKGYGLLSKTKADHAIPLSHLWFWRMSRDWYAIRNPVTWAWEAVHKEDLGVVPATVMPSLSTAQFAILLMYGICPTLSKWLTECTVDSETEQLLCNLTDVIDEEDLSARVSDLEQGLWQEEYERIVFEEDEDYEHYDYDPDDPFWASVSQLQEAAMRMHSAISDEWSECIEDFAEKVREYVPMAFVEHHIAPWDREEW